MFPYLLKKLATEPLTFVPHSHFIVFSPHNILLNKRLFAFEKGVLWLDLLFRMAWGLSPCWVETGDLELREELGEGRW